MITAQSIEMKHNNHRFNPRIGWFASQKVPSTVFQTSRLHKLKWNKHTSLLTFGRYNIQTCTFPYIICPSVKCLNKHFFQNVHICPSRHWCSIIDEHRCRSADWLMPQHGLYSWGRVPPGWDPLCRSDRSPRCGRSSTRGTSGTGGNVLPLHWWGWFLQCWCSWIVCW